MITVEITNRQAALSIDEDRLRAAVRAVLLEEGVLDAAVGIAVVDDLTIQDSNRRFLNHDYATDVLTFALEQDEHRLEGELMISAETAAASAAEYGWSAADELLLYVIHGTLHLAGYDDRDGDSLAEMRAQERRHLAHFGLVPRYDSAGLKAGDNAISHDQAARAEAVSDSIAIELQTSRPERTLS